MVLNQQHLEALASKNRLDLLVKDRIFLSGILSDSQNLSTKDLNHLHFELNVINIKLKSFDWHYS